jgi:hypothetical protein
MDDLTNSGFETSDIILAVWLDSHGHKAEVKPVSVDKVIFFYEDVPASLLWNWNAGHREIDDVVRAITCFIHLRRLSRKLRIQAFGKDAVLATYKSKTT